MSVVPRRILHIGQRKTGTTWLQYGLERAAETGLVNFAYWPIAKWSSGVTWKAVTAAQYEELADLLPIERDRPASRPARA